MPGSAARHATTNTQRLRGSTGSAMPASAATSPACGPAALTSVPHAMRRPSASVTPVTRAPSRAMRGDLAVNVGRALLPCRAAQQSQQRVRIEPAFAAAAERAEPEIGCLQPAEIVGERFPVHQHDVGAFGLLRLVVRQQRVLAGLAREQQIAALAKADVGLARRSAPSGRGRTRRRTRSCGCFPAWRTAGGSRRPTGSWRRAHRSGRARSPRSSR